MVVVSVGAASVSVVAATTVSVGAATAATVSDDVGGAGGSCQCWCCYCQCWCCYYCNSQ